jgi:putative phosphoserine phosphatase / 1-acylglycerol-3-phosphate O-acyltransferase
MDAMTATGTMGTTAAFFDLDRTLLAGGSGPVFSKAFADLGVKTPHIPGMDLMFKFFDLAGESYLVMQLAKRAASRAKGLRRDDVAVAAEAAADVLLPKVQPYARQLLRMHREQGDKLVLATTSPYDLVAPLARRLGFDAVVATRYAEIEGIYTGELDGGFVWGPGKLAAVKVWSTENNIDLKGSSAYSDSVFDSPLLGAVGKPTAVNPDARLRAVALLRSWPVRSLDAPEGVPSINGIELFDVMRQVTRPEFFPAVRFTFNGTENIPATGPAIIAVNHRSYFDPLAITFAIAKAGRNPRFLGKKEVFDAPVVGQFAKAMGAIRVDRGSGSDGPLQASVERLEAGEVVVILPEGTIPRGEAFFDPILRGKSGVARLAAMMPDVPVIPMGVWGTEKVWPRSSKLPDLLSVNDPNPVVITVGKPVSGLDRTTKSTASVHRDTERIMEAIMDLLPPESRVVRDVSAEELAKTTPDGKVPSQSKAAPAAGTKARSKKVSEQIVSAPSDPDSSPDALIYELKRVKTKKVKLPPIAQQTSTVTASEKPKKAKAKKSKATAIGIIKAADDDRGGPPTRRLGGTLASRQRR